MSDEVEKAKAAAGGEKVERTLFEKIIAREVSVLFIVQNKIINIHSVSCHGWSFYFVT